MGAMALSLTLSACATAQPRQDSSGAPTAPSGSPAASACQYRVEGEPSKPVDPPETANVPTTGTATVTMTLGGQDVTLTLDREAAPCTVNSFLSLAEQGFYTGTTCHRLSTQGLMMLQCGDPTGKGTGGPGYTFDDELAHTKDYPKGTLAMANAGPNTNGSQFFMVFGDSPLQPNYTVFGSLDEKSIQVLGDLAYQGHDNAWGDGTGRPLGDATISKVVVG